MVRLIDLSGDVEAGQPVYPSLQSTQFWVSGTHEEAGYVGRKRVGEETPSIQRKLSAQRAGMDGDHPIARTLLVSEHGPTHVDSLTHVDPTSDGSIDRLPLERFYGETVGIDVSHVGSDFITREDLEAGLSEAGESLGEGDMVTLYTGHREAYYDPDDIELRHAYFNEAPGLDEEAAYWLGDVGVTNIGIDAPSIDHGTAIQSQRYPAHDMCAEYEVLNMENMENLGAVAGRRYTLAAFPLKIDGGTGSPIRPVAILED